MARSNLQIKVGTYAGTGAIQTISDVGFAPDLIIIKGNSGTNHTVFKTSTMVKNETAYLASATANFTDGLTGFTSTGFVLSTNAAVNTNAVTYNYIAIRGTSAQRYFATGRYVGDGNDNRNLAVSGIYFTPDLAATKQNSTQVCCVAMAGDTNDNSFHFTNNGDTTNEIQALISNGFQVGSATRTNASGVDHAFFAFKNLSGAITSGFYTGNGVDGRKITGLGFTPSLVIVKTSTGIGNIKFSNTTDATSSPMTSAANVTDAIKSLDPDGFTIGTNAVVNTAGTAYRYIAIKAGNFNVPLSRTSS